MLLPCLLVLSGCWLCIKIKAEFTLLWLQRHRIGCAISHWVKSLVVEVALSVFSRCVAQMCHLQFLSDTTCVVDQQFHGMGHCCYSVFLFCQFRCIRKLWCLLLPPLCRISLTFRICSVACCQRKFCGFRRCFGLHISLTLDINCCIQQLKTLSLHRHDF